MPLPMTCDVALKLADQTSDNRPDVRERRGRRWLIWSFILCPCHLPITLGVLGMVFGGSAFGALIKSNGLGIGIALTSLYAVGLAIGLHHIQAANKDRNCSEGSCTIPT